MKTVMITTLCFALLLLAGCRTQAGNEPMRLYDLSKGLTLSQDQAVQQLQKMRIVLVGEHHDNDNHHQAQLQVIQTLHRAGSKVAIGMEMFRQESQMELDQWVTGQLDEEKFEPIYLNNWTYGWDLYRPIFQYARQNQIPMVGLNIPRKVTSQVAYHGFASLSPDQKGPLEGITCNVTPEYRDFVKKAYGAHGHGQMNFDRFCEAQLVWDTAMAIHAVDYLNSHPDHILVILAGSGHARKLGIPTQLDKTISWPYAVVLPETKGIFDKKSVTEQDADYLFLFE